MTPSLFVPAYQEPRGSAIREMARWAADPAFVSFAGGYPAADAFDTEGIQRAAERAWRDGAQQCLQYGSTEGTGALRAALQQLNRSRGIWAQDEQLAVTTGSQQGLDFLLRATVSPGDTVIVERPTYPGALQAFRLAGARIVGVPGDKDGLDPQAVAAVLESGGPKPRMVYLVSTFANPTGATMPLARRQALLALAARHGVLLVEDDPYGALRFSGAPVAPIAALACADPELQQVSVYLSTLSKIAVPALRIGWMVASADVVRRCVMAKQVSDMCSSPWLQHIAAAYLSGPDFAQHIPRIVGTYAERAQAMVSALRARFGSAWSFEVPQGGMFLWVRLPQGADATALLQCALQEKVLFVPGAACHGSDPEPGSLRLSYSTGSPALIREGIERLGRAYAAYCGR
jgi:DNA-binding transcriptional MocR family regulator